MYVVGCQGVFAFGLFVGVLQGFYANDMTSFTALEVFSFLSFNKLNEDLSVKVDKISSITFKHTICI